MSFVYQFSRYTKVGYCRLSDGSLRYLLLFCFSKMVYNVMIIFNNMCSKMWLTNVITFWQNLWLVEIRWCCDNILNSRIVTIIVVNKVIPTLHSKRSFFCQNFCQIHKVFKRYYSSILMSMYKTIVLINSIICRCGLLFHLQQNHFMHVTCWLMKLWVTLHM